MFIKIKIKKSIMIFYLIYIEYYYLFIFYFIKYFIFDKNKVYINILIYKSIKISLIWINLIINLNITYILICWNLNWFILSLELFIHISIT